MQLYIAAWKNENQGPLYSRGVTAEMGGGGGGEGISNVDMPSDIADIGGGLMHPAQR